MGLTISSVGRHAQDVGLHIDTANGAQVVALAGNPNVGKSTVFNELTGMRQHTGNWPGKTVTNAQGICVFEGQEFVLVDLPGTYSLMAHSAEEETARDFLCFGGADAAVVVCDATCLERNLNLVLQTLEIMPRTVVCVNLMDEAKKKGISVDCSALERSLGVPVVGTAARDGKGLPALMRRVSRLCDKEDTQPLRVRYDNSIEQAAAILELPLKNALKNKLPIRFAALKLLEGDETLLLRIDEYLGFPLLQAEGVQEALQKAQSLLSGAGYDAARYKDALVAGLYAQAERIAADVVQQQEERSHYRQLKLDRILTGKWTGAPIMLMLLALVFYITIAGANIPSQWLSDILFGFETRLSGWFEAVNAPAWLIGALIHGTYRVLAWVVSVMLPPMAIFFPLFTLLEDFGYLPRVAFNLDSRFKKCNACGKQSLTMCMGFGCNAAGVIGCRIIDSPRERLIAILTNNFVPCNGRFPALIAILTMFFIGTAGKPGDTLIAALMLTAVIALGVWMTFLSSGLLSKTLLRGIPSAFTLEMPPYRKPQIGRVIIRSVCDRTLFVLGRAASVAAPAGLLIWLLANVRLDGVTLLRICTDFLDPAGRFFGLDGVILMAFLLGLPANEIVVPIMVMAYLAQGTLMELDSLTALHALLTNSGWTWVTAICTMLLILMHWPCSTTLITIYKETRSVKWTAVAFLLPTLCGLTACAIISQLSGLLGLI